MKAASLSDHYAFVDGEEEIVLEASVKKITVKNSTSRRKINTQASIYSFFFGGFFFFISLSLSLFIVKWKYHFSYDWTPHFLVISCLWNASDFWREFVSYLSITLPQVCLCLSRSLSPIFPNKYEMKTMVAIICRTGSADGWITDEWDSNLSMARRAKLKVSKYKTKLSWRIFRLNCLQDLTRIRNTVGQ